MGAMSRRKGATFEREVANLIRDQLGFDCKRNLEQYQQGGDDLSGVPGWSIECKRYAAIVQNDLRTFWLQCEAQAAARGMRPGTHRQTGQEADPGIHKLDGPWI
jgi:hypothetical protein